MLIEELTMNASGDNSFANQGVVGGSVDSLMHDENIEFSDIDEPVMTRARTRSQSRVKESSQPPVELENKQKKGRPRRVVAAKRRAAVKEEPITDDDEDDIF